ncbi:hypothetical protein [Thiobacillus sp.]|jgi:hypothetical protein|uniref:hypothetical protein n=1 Tax=Thiobacillus sp. TaxID=924 RepID=UPI0025E95F52|nr:hypothetical protein [Thiobacillus sp.]
MKMIVFALLLAGCASLESPDPASSYYAYPPGWLAQLNQPLTIPPGSATVRLQYGQVVPRNGVQELDPYCVVELNTVRDTPQTLKPGRFQIWQVTRSVDFYAAAKSPLMKARYVDDDGGDVTPLYYKTAFRLHDPAQPNLRGMTCAWKQMVPGNPPLMRHLRLSEIRAALGDWITLIPPKAML